ncbi:MAG: hypothetical protein S4CHLAM123_01970 [Chlamydiales bacterium]|nr:hypothetical protein [Chlamydiales bacterium]
METLQELKEDLPLLVESGLIAIKQGDEQSAKQLFSAVGILDPENKAKKMGLGLIMLHKMDLKNAKKAFQEILQEEQDNYRAQSFLAFSHVLSVLEESTDQEKLENLQKGAELAQDVLDKCDAPSTRQLAQSLLDWEKDLMNKVDQDKGPMS